MASFGENLRREREMRGVTLEEISAATKISMRFLQALEAEKFSKLPGGIFTRSFIRAYTKYLGLNEEPVLAEFHLAAQPRVDFDLHRMSATKQSPQRKSSRPALLALFVAVAMLGGSYLLYRYSRRSADLQGKMMNPDRVSAAPSSGASSSGDGPAPALGSGSASAATATANPTGAGTAAASQPGQAPPAGKTPEADTELILQVAATEQAWVAVDADGKTTFQRILNPDEVRTIRAKESFDVITGNARGIILTLNGETLKPLGAHNAYKKIHLTRDDTKNPAP
jgi:cytoskeleton protein RodZ